MYRLSWFTPARRLLVLSVTLVLLPAMALVWLGWRLLEQDRALEGEQRRERCELAADRFSGAIEKVLVAERARLTEVPARNAKASAEGMVLVNLRRDRPLTTVPEDGLLFYPSPPALREPPQEPFQTGESFEFRDQNYANALAQYRPLAAARDPSVAAGARLLMARVLRKSGRIEDALAEYGQLTETDSISFGGVPVSLLAHRSRCLLLEQSQKSGQLRAEAQALGSALAQRRWLLDRVAYQHYTSLARQWAGGSEEDRSEAESLAAGVDWLWRQWTDEIDLSADGDRYLHLDEGPVTLLWRNSDKGLVAVVAGISYQQREWFQPALSTAGVVTPRVALIDEDGNLAFGSKPDQQTTQAVRSRAQTGLPWTIIVSDGAAALSNQFATRRRLLLAALAALLILLVGGAWLIGRTVSRELAVARLQSDFVSAVSHEFRTPLTSLQQLTEMLVDSENLTKDDQSLFHQAQGRATRRLRRLVESLLDFSRMESGKKAYRIESFDAAGLVGSVIEEFRAETSVKDLTIQCTSDENVPVCADPEALSWALWNLLDNAVKYGGEDHRINVEVAREGSRCTISVRDQGIGIPVREQERIFQKFVRGDAATSDGVPGTGIGLAMVKHVVEAHQGEIRLDSSPGNGSTFTLVLPGEE